MRANNIITMAIPESIVSESYRLLGTNIQHTSMEKKMQVVLVTSASPGEGKTTIIANLAATYAQENKKVLLIDANLRKPMLHHLFRNGNGIGLTNVLNDMVHVDDDVMQANSDHLFLIPSGPIPANPPGLFFTAAFDKLLEDMRKKFDIILIDCPAILPLADVPILASKCDGVLLVIHAKKGKKRLVKQAMSKLHSVHANVIGAVINDKSDDKEDKSFYYYQSQK